MFTLFLITYEYIDFFLFIAIAGSEGLILWVHFVADDMSFRNAHKGDNL
jgi:hypothetical protein